MDHNYLAPQGPFLTKRLVLQTLVGFILLIGLWIVIDDIWPQVRGVHLMGPVILVLCWRIVLATGTRPVALIPMLLISFVVAFTNPLRHGPITFAAYVDKISDFWALLVGVVGMIVVRQDARASGPSPSAATGR